MDIEKIKELTKKYVQLTKELHEHSDQFFTTIINGRVTREATKILNYEELDKLEEMENELKELRKQLLKAEKIVKK